MGKVNVRVGGRGYALACRDGEEERLAELAAGLDARAATLGARLGAMAEGRLLLSLALTLADELAERDAVLADAAARIDAVATALEAAA